LSGHSFVTGATGRIGRVLVARLIAEGQAVVGLARSEAGADQVRALGAQCVVGSMADADALAKGLTNASTVYHLAGGFRGPGAETPDQINRVCAEQLAQALEGHDPERVVFTSSCAVYGDRSSLWVDEQMPPHPHTRYGKSKVDAEAALSGLDGLCIVRLAATYGQGFPWLMDERIRDNKGWLPGEGRNFVPTIHVADAVTGLYLLGTRGAPGIYNLADQNPVPLRAFYDAVHGCVGGRPMRFWSTWIPSYVQFWAARNNERLQSRTGSTPRFTPDALRLFTASVRMRVDKIAQEVDMSWVHPEPTAGVRAVLNGGATAAT
jgi:nucleoside-diphosphate-sugar epimerase